VNTWLPWGNRGIYLCQTQLPSYSKAFPVTQTCNWIGAFENLIKQGILILWHLKHMGTDMHFDCIVWLLRTWFPLGNRGIYLLQTQLPSCSKAFPVTLTCNWIGAFENLIKQAKHMGTDMQFVCIVWLLRTWFPLGNRGIYLLQTQLPSC
jgi:hypothetical protein